MCIKNRNNIDRIIMFINKIANIKREFFNRKYSDIFVFYCKTKGFVFLKKRNY